MLNSSWTQGNGRNNKTFDLILTQSEIQSLNKLQSLKKLQNVPKATAEETSWQNIPKERQNFLIGSGTLNLSIIWELSVQLSYFKVIIVFVEPKFF